MPETASPPLDERKNALRPRAKDARAAAVKSVGAGHAATMLRDRVLAAVAMPRGCVVSAYWPMRDEIDPRPLMMALHGRGHPICLPVTLGRGRPLAFRAWAPDDRLQSAAFGTQIPAPGQPERQPRVLLVPLLAFDRAGYRLGYGGGFYDRTLAGLKDAGEALAVGLAYGGQELPEVPRDGNDQKLDWIVTEEEAIEIP
jgi:5-formyltetrahydrofolate cyclo-ligase